MRKDRAKAKVWGIMYIPLGTIVYKCYTSISDRPIRSGDAYDVYLGREFVTKSMLESNKCSLLTLKRVNKPDLSNWLSFINKRLALTGSLTAFKMFGMDLDDKHREFLLEEFEVIELPND